MQEVVAKITQKQEKINRQNSELELAKSMSYDSIIAEISKAKKMKADIQVDICKLVQDKEIQESHISKLNRIMLQKKKLAGA